MGAEFVAQKIRIGNDHQKRGAPMSLRMTVACAVRCVKRVQPLFRSDKQRDVRQLRRLIQAAEAFAADEDAYETTRIHDSSAYPPSQDFLYCFGSDDDRTDNPDWLKRYSGYGVTFHFADDVSARVAQAAAFAASAASFARTVPKVASNGAPEGKHPWGGPARTSEWYANETGVAATSATNLARAAVRTATRGTGDRGEAVFAFDHAAHHDRARVLDLARRRGESSHGLGDTIDLSAGGPLGPLWPEGVPESLKTITSQQKP